MKIIYLKTKKEISEEDLAVILYKEGQHIIYCDLEGVAKLLDKDEYYLIDECGNGVWIDPSRFKIVM